MTVRKFAVLLALGWMGACSDNPASGPDQPAALRITTLTNGPDMDGDGYMVRLDIDPPVPLAANGALSLSDVAPGRHAVELSGVSDNCTVVGPNPDSVTTARGATAEVAFVVGCRKVEASGLVVSNPVLPPGGAPLVAAAASAHGDAATDSVAYVSLAAGSVPDGRVATVRSMADSLTLTTDLLDGGFDPVAVPAHPGDSVEIRVTDATGGTLLRTTLAVMPTRQPVVVRTQPPPRKRDVPLNTTIVVVFSEPLNPATITGESVQLLGGATPVAGNVRLLEGSGVTAVFEPAEPLSPNTQYRLVVTDAIRDLQGDVLDAPAAADFTTGHDLAGPVASVTLSYSLVEGFFPTTTVIRAYVRDASGNDLVGREVTWASSDPTVASVSQGLGGEAGVTLHAGGIARIIGASEGRADTALVVSRPLPLDIATGALRVVAATTGSNPDTNGYGVIVDGGPAVPIASNDSITVGGLSVGTHTVAFGGVAANCAITDSLGSEVNPRTVTILGADTVETTIAVACTPRTGTLRVIVTTTGDSLDVDGYRVAVAATGDYASVQRIGLNDTVTFVGLPLGEVWIHLFDVAANCTVSGGDNVRPVTIAPDVANEYAYTVACAAVTSPGAIALTTSTTGVDIDRDGYWVRVDDGALLVSMNATYRVVISPIELGTHTFLLYMVSSNCHIAGDNPRTVAVSAGDTTEVAFEITCSAAERIAFDGSYCTPSPLCYPVVLVTFADGTNTNVVASYGHDPTWSPAGDRIAFTSVDGDINVVTYDGLVGGTITRLTTHSANDRSPAWSPDGSRIAFTSERDGQPELYLMNADGSALVRVTNSVGFVGQPAWSPDGVRIAFDCEVETGNRDICAVNVDGTGLTRLTNDPAPDFDAAWSPDGAKIAFATGRYDAFPEIAVLAVDGSGVTRVRAGTSGVQPSWSPDGTRIASFSQSLGGLCIMNADGSSLVLLRQGANPPQGANPAWRPVPPSAP